MRGRELKTGAIIGVLLACFLMLASLLFPGEPGTAPEPEVTRTHPAREARGDAGTHGASGDEGRTADAAGPSTQEDGTGRRPGDASDRPADDEASPPDAPQDTEPSDQAPPPPRGPVPPEGASVLGTVRHPDGSPAAGVLVEARPEGRDGEEPPSGTDRTSESGRFGIPGLEEDASYVVRVAREGARPTAVETATAPARDVVLVLRRGVAVSGRVLGPRGGPLAGARVYLHRPGRDRAGMPVLEVVRELERMDRDAENVSRARVDWMARDQGLPRSRETGPDGTFRIPGIAEGAWRALAIHPDHPVGAADVRVPAEPPGPRLEVRLDPALSLRGRVVDGEGRPVPRGRIFCHPTDQDSGVPLEPGGGTGVDGEGRFRVRGLDPGSHRVIWATFAPDDHIPRRTESATVRLQAGGENRIEIVIPRGTTVHGVVHRGGEPLADALVQLVDAGAGGVQATTTTDEEGRFEMTGVDPGPHQALITNRDTGDHEGVLEVEVPDRPEVELDLDLPDLGVAGRVLGPGDEPVEGALVIPFRGGEEVPRDVGDLRERAVGQDRTAADGTFRVHGLEDEPVGLLLLDEDHAPTHLRNVHPWAGATPSDGRAVRVDLEAGVPTTIRVVDPTGEPVAGARVHLVNADNGAHVLALDHLTDEEGAYRTKVRPGTYDVVVGADGLATVRLDGRSIGRGDEVRVRPGPGETLTVRCLDPEGRPVSDAYLTLYRPDGTEVDRPRPTMLLDGTLEADSSGYALWRGLAPGSYRIRWLAPGGRTVERSVEVEAGEGSTVRLRLP